MADRWKVTQCSLWLTVVSLLGGSGLGLTTFDKHPSDVTVIEGQETQLDCRVHEDASRAEWYVYTAPNNKYRIDDGFQNRFFLRNNEGTTILFINNTSPSDQGIYFCESGTSASQNATLRVLPEKWTPHCTYIHNGNPVGVGDQLDIVCISSGDSETNLRWMRNNDVIFTTSRRVNGSSVILYASVVISDQAEVFICEASLPDLHATEICVLRPVKDRERSPGAQYVAYAVVILLSIIVVVLFVVMIVVILRQRQCRYFHRPQPPPQTVLDMDQLQSRLGPSGLSSGTRQSDHDNDSIGSAFDLVGPGSLGPPPDVVPTDHHRGNVTQRSSSPTSTIRHNMDLNNEPEKTGIKTPKIQSPRNDRRASAVQESYMEHHGSHQEVADISLDPNIPSTSNGMTLNNHPSTSNEGTHSNNSPSTSNSGSFHPDRPSTSADTAVDSNRPSPSTGTTLKKNKDRMNDLGTLKKERLYRKSKMAVQRKQSLENTQLATGVVSVNNLDSISLNIKDDEVE